MKILIVNNLFGEIARGGAETVIATQAEYLITLGYEVVIVSGVPETKKIPAGVCVDELDKSLCNSGIDLSVTTTGIKHYTYQPSGGYFYTELVWKGAISKMIWHLRDMFNQNRPQSLAKIIAVENPDVVHTNNLMGLGFKISAMLKEKKIKHIHTVHDVQLMHPSGLVKHNWRAKLPHELLYIKLMKDLMGSPDTVVFPSEYLMKMHDQYGYFPNSKKILLRNPAPEGRPRPMVKNFGKFLFVGQFEEHKGILDLLEAWRTWGGGGSQLASLTVAGSGSLDYVVREAAGTVNGVHYFGRLNRSQVFELLAESDWLVVPSRLTENAPAIIMEAFSFGVPVIASRVGGVPELIQHDINGYLFNQGDRNELIEVLDKAMKVDKNIHHHMAEMSLKFAEELSIKNHGQILVSLYK